jgi:hypothetical protein
MLRRPLITPVTSLLYAFEKAMHCAHRTQVAFFLKQALIYLGGRLVTVCLAVQRINDGGTLL